MAFNSNAARSNASAQSSSREQSWKAQGFINFYLPTKDGSRNKLGAVSLRKSNSAEAKLATWLEADAANIASVSSKLIVEYNSTEVPVDLDLGTDFGDVPVQTADAPPAPDPVETSKMRGYFNFYLPTNDGGRKKLGAIGLRKNHPKESKLALWLEQSDDNIQTVVDKLILQYNSAEARANADFALG